MPNWKKVIVSGSNASLNSLTVSNGITGSLFGTASYASNGGVTQLLAGPNVTLSPTNGLGQVTVSSTSGGGGFNTATGSYGSFYDTTTQTNPVGNIPRSMSLNTTDITNGVSVSGSTNPFNTYIKTENAGVYNIQFSAQLDKTDSGVDDVVIWLRKNGINLTDTATTITLNGNNDKQVAAWNWFVNSAANDYYQIIWQSLDTDLRLLAEPADGHPGIPSVIVTANRIDQFLSNTGSFTGSFIGQFTGSLQGTASFASNALSSSFATNANTANTASYVNTLIQNVSISGTLNVSQSINVPVVNTPLVQNGSQYIAQDTNTSITAIQNGSYTWRFYPGGTLQPAGAIVGSTFDATSVDVTQNVLLLKSLYYGAQIITAPDGVTTKTWSFKTDGDLEIPTGRYITGSLFGTASYASQALSSSYAATSSFASTFTVAGTLTAQTLNVQTVSSSVIYSSGSNVFGNQQSNTQVFTGSVNITGSLNVNGGEIFAGRIDNGSEGGQVSFGRALDNNNGWYIDVYGSTSTPSLRFIDVSTAAVRMTISGSGAITMGQSLAVGPINPSAVAGRIDASNDVVAFSTSDKRLKENIQPIENAIEKLDKIGGYTFDWNNQVEIHGYEGNDVGIIADEIEEVLPEVVTTRDNGYKAVKYEKLVAFLIQVDKEQQEIIKDQQRQIDELRELINIYIKTK